MTSIVWGSLVPRRWGAWCVEHANLHLLLLQIQICCHKEFAFVSSISYGTKISKQSIAKIQKNGDELRLNPLQRLGLQKHFESLDHFHDLPLRSQWYLFKATLLTEIFYWGDSYINILWKKNLISRLPSRGGLIFLVAKMARWTSSMGTWLKCNIDIETEKEKNNKTKDDE